MYPQQCYLDVLRALDAACESRIPVYRSVWFFQIKRLFDRGFLVQEIIDAIPKAFEKQRWPQQRKLFSRIQDVILLARKKQNPVRLDGLESTKDILSRRLPPTSRAGLPENLPKPE